MQLPTVGFEPWSSHTAVRRVTARPLRIRSNTINSLFGTALVARDDAEVVLLINSDDKTTDVAAAAAAAATVYPLLSDVC